MTEEVDEDSLASEDDIDYDECVCPGEATDLSRRRQSCVNVIVEEPVVHVQFRMFSNNVKPLNGSKVGVCNRSIPFPILLAKFSLKRSVCLEKSTYLLIKEPTHCL